MMKAQNNMSFSLLYSSYSQFRFWYFKVTATFQLILNIIRDYWQIAMRWAPSYHQDAFDNLEL